MAEVNLRAKRLKNNYHAMVSLAEKAGTTAINRIVVPRLEFKTNGDVSKGEYPDIYDIILRIRSYRNVKEEVQNEHRFTIYLPAGYPTERPVVRWNSEIFHPNLLGTLDKNDERYKDLIEQLDGDEERLARDINQNPEIIRFLDSYVCLDGIRENYTPSVGLDAIVVEIANMVRYRKYNLGSILNLAAAEWVKSKLTIKGFFPSDPRGLIDVDKQAEIRVVRVNQP